MLPPLSADDYRWLADRFKPEEEYYRLYSDKPLAPAKGMFLLLREPYSSSFKVVYPSGDFKMFEYSRNTPREMSKLGIPEEKVEKVLSHLWNFGKVYVKSDNPEVFSPKLETRD